MELLKILEGVRTPFWDNFFLAVTKLGGETLFLVVILTILWCIDKKTGYYLVYAASIGLGLNRIINAVCMVDRPWIIDKRFTIVEGARGEAAGYSFPSGHTQNAVSLFGGLAVYWKSGIAKTVSVVIIILVGFSRLYLGVHTLYDVLASIIIGSVINIIVFYLYKYSDNNEAISAMPAFIAIFISAALLITALLTQGDNGTFNADNIKMAYMAFGATTGVALAWFLDKKYIKYETGAHLGVQIFKCIAGIIVILLTRMLLKKPLDYIFSGHMVSHSFRYFCVAVMGGIIWPMSFEFWNKHLSKIRLLRMIS
jgi:membrane-associated phospholipid phosphatase